MPPSISLVPRSELLKRELDVLALAVHEQAWLADPAVTIVDQALASSLKSYAEASSFAGKAGQLLIVASVGQLSARNVVLVGMGQKSAEQSEATLRTAAANAARAAVNLNARSMGFVAAQGMDLRALAEGLTLGAYRFDKYFTGDNRPKFSLDKITVFSSGDKPNEASKRELDLGRRIGNSVWVARDAVNEPPNVLYPASFADVCRNICKPYPITIKVMNKAAIDKQGMQLFSAVAQGSAHEPRLIHMTYKPTGAKKKLVFVGKGLTFDSGGLCIKPAPGMGEMKSDMAGAAAVLGLMAALGELKPKIEVHGIIGAAENMPDGNAYRPGDVFRSMAGKTVEIINTDAEGRLVLADVLAYATAIKPQAIIDAATLTGAMLVALGKGCTGYFSTNDELAGQLQAASVAAGESMWRMPLLDELVEQLKSDIADLKHTGDRFGGSITAALFLREFVGEIPWVHCDIAGPSFSDRARGLHPKGGTGHPVLTFLKMVERLV